MYILCDNLVKTISPRLPGRIYGEAHYVLAIIYNNLAGQSTYKNSYTPFFLARATMTLSKKDCSALGSSVL